MGESLFNQSNNASRGGGLPAGTLDESSLVSRWRRLIPAHGQTGHRKNQGTRSQYINWKYSRNTKRQKHSILHAVNLVSVLGRHHMRKPIGNNEALQHAGGASIDDEQYSCHSVSPVEKN